MMSCLIFNPWCGSLRSDAVIEKRTLEQAQAQQARQLDSQQRLYLQGIDAGTGAEARTLDQRLRRQQDEQKNLQYRQMQQLMRQEQREGIRGAGSESRAARQRMRGFELQGRQQQLQFNMQRYSWPLGK